MAYADYSSLFSQGEQKYGLRSGTGAALGYLESRYNPRATSPKGAMGLLQLMPGTARDMGVSNAYDPSANVDGGLHYFSNILNGPAKGDYRTAAMMYNAGPNRSSFPQSSQAYADQFMGQLPVQQSAQPGEPPVAQPASLGSLANGPTSLDTSPAQYLMPPADSLGALAQAASPQQLKPNKFTAGNALGVLGDALMAYSGMKPSFAPFMQEQKILGQQQDFERQKFNQELQMRMYAMLHPEAFMQAQVFNNMPAEQQHSFLQYKDATDPINVSTPQGTQNVPRTETKSIGGKNYYRVGNNWYEEGQ